MVRLFKRLISSVGPRPALAVASARADRGEVATGAVTAPDRRQWDGRVRAGAPVAVDSRRQGPPPARRRFWRRGSTLTALALLAILAVATFLRVWKLGAIGFRGDEAVYAGQASVLAGNHEAERWFTLISRGNSNFLLYQQIVALVYRAVGISDVAARVVAALCSTLTVPVTFLIAKLLYGRRAGLYAALLLARAGALIAGLALPSAIVQEGGYNLDLLGTLLQRFLTGWGNR
jgi:hypothetical protein